MEQVFLNSNNYNLTLCILEAKNPKAVIQIAHGMCEHHKRYLSFAEFLVENDYTVVLADMRGHGENSEMLGFFADKNGDEELVNDQVNIALYIRGRYSSLPLYLFAHSMGTIISRVVLQNHSSLYDKVCLSGYPAYQSAVMFGKPLASLVSLFKGKKKRSKFLNNMVVGQFNKAIKNPRTPVDWLSYNEENVNAYMGDKLSGFGFTTSANRDLMSLMIKMSKAKRYQNINNIPLLMLRGKDDPCVGGEKGSQKSINTLKKAGFGEIKEIVYDNMRHEILNEKEKDLVYQDILKFYNL